MTSSSDLWLRGQRSKKSSIMNYVVIILIELNQCAIYMLQGTIWCRAMKLARFYFESGCECDDRQDGERFLDDLQHMIKEQHQ